MIHQSPAPWNRTLNLSAILVRCAPEHTAQVVESLGQEPGFDVHHVDEPGGRIIVVQEAARIDEEVDGLGRLQSLPHVSTAALVYHYFEEDPEIGGRLSRSTAEDRAAVPTALQNTDPSFD